MSGDPSPLVFDSGPLSHFAEKNWLNILEKMTSPRKAVIPDVVRQEMQQGVAKHPHLKRVLDADWIETRSIEDIAETVAFAKYAERLVVGHRNRGECGVLALADVHGWTAIIDDDDGRSVGLEFGVSVKGTLALLCDAIRAEYLTVALVSDIADDLLATNYYLPFRPGGFAYWAYEQGMV